MNEEIKEILDYLKRFINDKEEITKYGCEISVKEAKLLLDYITNLQEELKYSISQVQHNQIVSKLSKEKYDLQKENERLKAINEEYERLNKEKGRGFKITNVEKYNIDELLDYKSRNEKAIEFLKEYHNYENRFKWCEQDYIDTINQVENILQGSAKEMFEEPKYTIVISNTVKMR